MKFALVTALSLLATAYAAVEVELSYHQNIGIPMAASIKAAEDVILANQNTGERIIGGSVSKPNAHPYLGALLINLVNRDGISLCGSSLIAINKLVTAARCVFDGVDRARRITAVLGSPLLFSGGDRIPTSRIVVHPNWNPARISNNIAIATLLHRPNIGVNIQPIALPSDHLTDGFIGSWSVASGYGKTSDAQTSVSLQSVARNVNLLVISVLQCREVFGDPIGATDMCTSGYGGVGICAGDIGGPLITIRNGERILIGISSFVAADGCEAGYPSGFTRVTSFYEFIKQNM